MIASVDTPIRLIEVNTVPEGYFAERKPIIVVMGVCGCGKTTVANELAEWYGMKFAEADDFHPQANIDKMASGTPLTDEDRKPWLDLLAAWIDERIQAGEPAVLTCSALKKAYRERLRRDTVVFVYMKGDFDTVMKRLSSREGHFMKPAMLRSQFAILEEPDETELHVDVAIGRATSEQEAAVAAEAIGL